MCKKILKITNDIFSYFSYFSGWQNARQVNRLLINYSLAIAINWHFPVFKLRYILELSSNFKNYRLSTVESTVGS